MKFLFYKYLVNIRYINLHKAEDAWKWANESMRKPESHGISRSQLFVPIFFSGSRWQRWNRFEGRKRKEGKWLFRTQHVWWFWFWLIDFMCLLFGYSLLHEDVNLIISYHLLFFKGWWWFPRIPWTQGQARSRFQVTLWIVCRMFDEFDGFRVQPETLDPAEDPDPEGTVDKEYVHIRSLFRTNRSLQQWKEITLHASWLHADSFQGVSGDVGSPGQKGEVGYSGPYVSILNP